MPKSPFEKFMTRTYAEPEWDDGWSRVQMLEAFEAGVKQGLAEAAQALVEHANQQLKVNIPAQCPVLNPRTDHRCTMGVGHAGPHKIGSVYRPSESWVTRCTDRPCDYRWLECIRCGHILR